jgi:hypothetical protein
MQPLTAFVRRAQAQTRFALESVLILLILRFFARRKDFSCRFPLHFIDLVELTAESRSLKACGFAALCLFAALVAAVGLYGVLVARSGSAPRRSECVSRWGQVLCASSA